MRPRRAARRSPRHFLQDARESTRVALDVRRRRADARVTGDLGDRLQVDAALPRAMSVPRSPLAVADPRA